MKAVIRMDGTPLNFELEGSPAEILEFTKLSAQSQSKQRGTVTSGSIFEKEPFKTDPGMLKYSGKDSK